MKEYEINILGYKWKLQFVDDKHKALNKGGEAVGRCCPDQFVILVRESLNVDLKRITIIHEIVHAMLAPLNELEDENVAELIGMGIPLFLESAHQDILDIIMKKV